VNKDQPVENAALERGYLVIERVWKAGDTLRLNLPMPVRRIAANPNVVDDRGCLAIARGPIVYCIESVDLPDGVPLEDLRWDPDRGGAVCTGCARGGRPLQPAVRAALVRLSRTPLAEATAQALPVDVNRDCREALLEIINHHVSGPLKTVEFIAKVARAAGQP